MCHSWAFAKLAHRSAELEKQQVWTPLGLSDKFTHTCADTHTHAHHLDSISTCWRAYNHHPFLSVAPHSLSKDPVAKPGGCCKERRKKEEEETPPPPHLTHKHILTHTYTEFITFAREEACPAQLWLSPLPSNNHDLHALPVKPLLLAATGKEGDRKKESQREKQ